ncbi:MAG: LURP-one-related family protein [Anaerolineales bacterium]|nr:LURP-one-related family protein [Anaerolineales bacterium]
MREKMVSIGDDFWIENQGGQKVFKVDGKALRVRDTLKFEDRQGHELCKIQEKKVRVKDTMNIEGPDGKTLASVKKALITPVRDRWTVKIGNGPDLDVQGNIVDHEYKIEEGRTKVAEVSKKWFRVRDTYGVEIAPGQNDIVILAVTVAIDMMR